jgi:hypothetical protein
MAGRIFYWFAVSILLCRFASATELTRAIRLEDAPAVEAVLKAGKDVNTLDLESLSPLYYAVVAGRADWVQSLIEKGADPNLAGQKISPLKPAATNGDAASAKLLLDAGVVIPAQCKEDDESHPVIAAVWSSRLEVLKLIVAKYPNLNYPKILGDAAVTMAVNSQNTALALFLIDLGCATNWRLSYEPDAPVEFGTQAMEAALIAGESMQPVVERLLAKKQYPIRRQEFIPSYLDYVPEWDAFITATRIGDVAFVRRFIDDEIELKDSYKYLLWECAHRSENEEMVRMISKRVGPLPARSKIEILDYGEPTEGSSEQARMLLPRRNKIPPLKEPKAPVTVAVIASPDAANEGESLSAILPSLPGWSVVERGLVASILKENQFKTPWADGVRDITRIGDRLAADTLLLATAFGKGGEKVLCIEVVDVRTGLALHRIHCEAKNFKPQEFARDIAAEVTAARERFAANHGKIAAVNVLTVSSPPGAAELRALAALVRVGLTHDIDNTPGAISIQRGQMQPLIEERAVAGSESLWGAAWSIEAGLELGGAGQVKCILRATDLQTKRTLDVTVEGAIADPPSLVHAAWAKLQKETGILGSAATPDPAAGQREAAGLLAECRWLFSNRRSAEAARAADAARYLGADPEVANGLGLSSRLQGLPDSHRNGMTWNKILTLNSLPEALRLLTKLPQMTEMAEFADHCLMDSPKLVGSMADVLEVLIAYRDCIPHIPLTEIETQGVAEYHEALKKLEQHFAEKIVNSPQEHKAMKTLVNETDIWKNPCLRAWMADWFKRSLEQCQVIDQDPMHSIRTLYARMSDAEKLELTKECEAMLQQSSHPKVPLLRAEFEYLNASPKDCTKALRAMFAATIDLAELWKDDPKALQTLPFIWFGNSVPRVPIETSVANFEPKTADAFLPELVVHPRVCGELFRLRTRYWDWIRIRSEVASGNRQWLDSFVSSFPKHQTELSKCPPKDMLDLVSRCVQLPPNVKADLQDIVNKNADLAPGPRLFGKQRMIPEIRFRNELTPTKCVPFYQSKSGLRFAARSSSIARDTSTNQVWIGGQEAPLKDIYPLLDGGKHYTCKSDPLLIRFDPDSETITEFRWPGNEQTMWRCEVMVRPADDYCAFALTGRVTPLFAAPSKGSKGFILSKDIRPDKDSFLNACAPFQHDLYVIDAEEITLNDDGRSKIVRRLFRLSPDKPPVELVRTGRRPSQSPLDDSYLQLVQVESVGDKIVLYGDGTARDTLACSIFDPGAQTWSALKNFKDAQRIRYNNYADRWRTEGGSFSSGSKPFLVLKLSDGTEFGIPMFHNSGQLVLRSKPNGHEDPVNYFIPISLPLPDDFRLPFTIVLKDAHGQQSQDEVTAQEFMRTAFARPLAVAQTDTHLIMSVLYTTQFNTLVPISYFWYFPKAEIEKRLLELLASKK